mmetsp:Transcript_26575/g.58841  ORF Transcript_26575/g.58841 Transcript_26575/m.58841 type:complete len:222 (+) Transcript_26575:2224-2889(+)
MCAGLPLQPLQALVLLGHEGNNSGAQRVVSQPAHVVRRIVHDPLNQQPQQFRCHGVQPRPLQQARVIEGASPTLCCRQPPGDIWILQDSGDLRACLQLPQQRLRPHPALLPSRQLAAASHCVYELILVGKHLVALVQQVQVGQLVNYFPQLRTHRLLSVGHGELVPLQQQREAVLRSYAQRAQRGLAVQQALMHALHTLRVKAHVSVEGHQVHPAVHEASS